MVGQYNWGTAVFKFLLESIRKFKCEGSRRNKKEGAGKYFDGCAIGLLV